MTVLQVKNRQVNPQYLIYSYGKYKYLEFYKIPIEYLLQELKKGIFNNDRYVRNKKIREYIITRNILELEKKKETKKEDIGFVSLS